MNARTALNGTKEVGLMEVDSDDVVMASVLYPSVWNSEDISSVQSTVDDIANSFPGIDETLLQSKLICLAAIYSILFSFART